MNNRDIFSRRIAFKPFEYPAILNYKDAINHSFWLVSEFNFTADIQDFQTKLTPQQQCVIKNTLLAISQIEVSVKGFWGKLGDRFPKAEFSQVGFTFAESEVRHADAYSHLLQVLGLNDDYANLLQVDVIKGRVEYLTKYLRGASDSSDENFALTLTLFALFIENVSLFSQFAIIKSFNKHLNILKDIDNVVQATQQEEQIHAMLGAQILRYVKEENPEWFNEEFYDKVKRACNKAFSAEAAIIDWIFESGELPFISKESLKEFIKQRFNDSVAMIDGSPVFEVDQKILSSLSWFEDELKSDTHNDFFNKKSTAYAKKMKPVTAKDLF
jgi:ribonucleoside-diphosphate reductase beta chain